MASQRGNIHIAVIMMFVVIGIIVLSLMNRNNSKRDDHRPSPLEPMPYSNGMTPSEGVNPFLMDNQQVDAEHYVIRHVDPRLQQAENIIYSAVNTESKLLKLKADAILVAWDTIDQNDQDVIIRDFSKEIDSHRAETAKFLAEFDTQRWYAMVKPDKKKQVEDLLKSIVSKQMDMMKFTEMLKNMSQRGIIR